jgi:S1-C subfamily serine protease
MLNRTRSLCSIATLLFASATVAAPAEEQPSRSETQQKLDAAHERLEQAAREVADLSANLSGDPRTIMFLGHNPNRAILGIGIGREDKDKEADGVRVLSVSPGGPAANAGLKAGDVLLDMNGKSLKRDKDEPNDKLLAELAKLSPGDDVSLNYRREGKVSVVKLKAERLPRTASMPLHFDRRFHDEHSDFGPMREYEIKHGVGQMMRGPFGAMELVPLSPKLGQYFGTEKGLLIVRVPPDKELKLEDGDVLMDIDGRIPSNASHAFRILGSYQAGEKVKLNVLRQRKKLAIDITVPEQESRSLRLPIPPRPPKAERPINTTAPPPSSINSTT